MLKVSSMYAVRRGQNPGKNVCLFEHWYNGPTGGRLKAGSFLPLFPLKPLRGPCGPAGPQDPFPRSLVHEAHFAKKCNVLDNSLNIGTYALCQDLLIKGT